MYGKQYSLTKNHMNHHREFHGKLEAELDRTLTPPISRSLRIPPLRSNRVRSQIPSLLCTNALSLEDLEGQRVMHDFSPRVSRSDEVRTVYPIVSDQERSEALRSAKHLPRRHPYMAKCVDKRPVRIVEKVRRICPRDPRQPLWITYRLPNPNALFRAML